MDTVIQSQMDTVIHSLRQRFRQTRSSSRSSSRLQQHQDDSRLDAYTPDLMTPAMYTASTSQAPTPLPTKNTYAAADGMWQRGSSVKSRNSFKLLKRKLFGGTSKNGTNADTGEANISAAPSEENLVWTAPSSPQIGAFNSGPNIPRRRNSARLRELQRLLRAYHEQRNGWTSTPSSPRTNRRPFPMEPPSQNTTYHTKNFDRPSRQTVHMPVERLSYCRGELGPERPVVLEPLSDQQNYPNYPYTGSNVMRRQVNLSELELALLNNANPSCPPTLLTNSCQSVSPPQPYATVQTQPRTFERATTVVEEKHAYFAAQQHQITASSKELRYQGATTVTSTTYFPSWAPSSQTDFLAKKQTQTGAIIDLPSMSPSPYEQIRSYVAPQAMMPKSNGQISNQIVIDQKTRKDFGERSTEKHKQKKKKRRNKTEEMPKLHSTIEPYTEAPSRQISDTLPIAQLDDSSPKMDKAEQNAKICTKGGPSNILSLGLQQLIQRHRHQNNQFQSNQPKQQQQQGALVAEPLLKSARSEPRLASRANRREHWLLMSRPELPGSTFLSPTPSFAALEHLDRLRDRISETKYVTAVFESRGGLGPVLNDVQAELEHWLGDTSKLLAIACEVHWSVPERFRSRQMEIELKQCLHAVLRLNNRRVLSLNDGNKAEQQATSAAVSPADSPFLIARGQRHRSYSTHSLNNRPAVGGGRPFPIGLARSKTEESCIRDAELDAFQGIYRRFYPALLPLQDPATVKAHQGYWTLENLTDERKAPLVPDPARFLYQPEQPAQLVRKSLVALNMAVLRMVGDERDYDADEARGKQTKTPGLKESDL